MLPYLCSLYGIFLKIGLFTIGGGYAMIPLMEREIITRHGWLTAAEFLDIVAVAEVTPGPLAINAATFIGYRLGGFGGAMLASLGVITPSLVILLLFGNFLMQLILDPCAERFLKGLRPALIALISVAVITLGRAALVDLTTALIAAGLFVIGIFCPRLNPLYLIVMGALLGLLFYPY
ncbi:MAG: chromate transporter [Dethiobacteria bacterium]|jgi:chromate transporter|nr:chromate transporter [Bacillota bacterium]NMD34098.1 chromate transporter [Bacillota bacterium]HOB29547.1 chromate transporter [Bacillota bacterium]HPZ42092.1 chromate transporter [Bacillota bacterium]HQD52234.1 chromate transporter [Bacillota bacterium]